MIQKNAIIRTSKKKFFNRVEKTKFLPINVIRRDYNFFKNFSILKSLAQYLIELGTNINRNHYDKKPL